MNNPDDDLPSAFVRGESPQVVHPQREAAESVLGEGDDEDDDDFSALEGAFTSIENSEEFAGLEGDVDRHTPPAEAQASHVNEYGVKMRGAKRCQPLADDDEIHFSVNLGDD